jgi:MYXO-CTERM domain-containing protein
MQGLRIDDSAFCRLNGCDGGGGGTTDEGSCACSTLPGDDSPFTVGAWIATALGAGFSVARRKNQSRNRI